MKTSLLAIASAAALFFSTAAFAAGPPNDYRYDNRGRDKDTNYGPNKNARVSPSERARWEAEQRRVAEQKRLAEQQRLAEEQRLAEQRRLAEQQRFRDRYDDYAKNHRVTSQERARWEAAHRNDRDRR
jgi:DNA-directed RNA polymerase